MGHTHSIVYTSHAAQFAIINRICQTIAHSGIITRNRPINLMRTIIKVLFSQPSSHRMAAAAVHHHSIAPAFPLTIALTHLAHVLPMSNINTHATKTRSTFVRSFTSTIHFYANHEI